MDDRQLLYTRGRYQVVAWLPDASVDDADAAMRFAVLDGAGVRLRDELTLDDARAWVDRRIDDEQRERTAPAPRTRLRRSRG